ncbi:unnamed protein product [Amoebophrya sp. A120]|nr:unnamed protein product [Amoebophrya sp. A120]|eukprot:GSA120T00013726001.1
MLTANFVEPTPPGDSSTKAFFQRQIDTFENDKNQSDQDLTSLWKNFGCETKAGRALRSLYHDSKSHAKISGRINRNRGMVKTSSQSKFDKETALKEAMSMSTNNGVKKCPQRDGKVPIPRVGLDKRQDDEDDWTTIKGHSVIRGKKPLTQIKAENNEFVEVQSKVGVRRGRDNDAMKRELANKFQFGTAYMSPAELKMRRERREEEEQLFAMENENLTRQDVEMYEDLKQGIKERQMSLTVLDRQLQDNPELLKPKERILLGKEALELDNRLQKDLQALQKFELEKFGRIKTRNA